MRSNSPGFGTETFCFLSLCVFASLRENVRNDCWELKVGDDFMVNFMDFYYTGPGTLAGRYMRKFWHPVYRAEDLKPGWAKPIKILGEQFTLYRGETGTPHVVDFRCPHRLTQLSVGWVEGDSIRCRVHGWKYDSTGQCTEQPAEKESFAEKIRIRSYPTQEYLKLIFVYFGDGEPPPLPGYPDFEKDSLWAETYVR